MSKYFFCMSNTIIVEIFYDNCEIFLSCFTKEMKKKWKISNSNALSDFVPTIILKAKDFATEITIFNTKEKKDEK